MKTPNMTKEQRSELRQLKAELRTLNTAQAKVNTDKTRALNQLRREAIKKERAIVRETTRVSVGIVKHKLTLLRRVEILTGRLS